MVILFMQHFPHIFGGDINLLYDPRHQLFKGIVLNIKVLVCLDLIRVYTCTSNLQKETEIVCHKRRPTRLRGRCHEHLCNSLENRSHLL